MSELKVSLEKHCEQLEELKELIKFYESKQCMFSSFQKLTIAIPEKPSLLKDEEMWDRNVFKNLTRFNTFSTEVSHRRHIFPTSLS